MMIATLRHVGLLLAAMVALLLAAANAAAGSIRINDQAGCQGPTITLGDVAELEGEYAQSLAKTVVGAFREGASEQDITLVSIEAALQRSDVNWGKLALGGHKVCKVYRTPLHIEPQPVNAKAEAGANVKNQLTLATPMTLGDLVVQRVESMAELVSGDLRVSFNERDKKLLLASAVSQRYEIEPMTSTTIGRIPLMLRRYDAHGRVDQSFSVTAQVERQVYGLVATQTIHKGRAFLPDAVELRQLWLDQDRGDPILNRSMIVGQLAATQVRKGTVIYPYHVKSPRLVKRGELITVRCISGLLVVRTTARAQEDGSMDDMIQVRDEVSGHQYVVTVTGSRQGFIALDRADNQTPHTTAQLRDVGQSETALAATSSGEQR